MTVGKKVAEWRRELGLSERAAAAKIGVSQPTLRSVERNDVDGISLRVARRFVRALDGAITLDDFDTGPRRRPAA